MTKDSEMFAGNGLGPESGRNGVENSISVQGSAIEFPLEEEAQSRGGIHPENHGGVGEGQNAHAFRGSVPVIETDFAKLSDGRMIEMIENSEDPASSLLAVFKDGAVSRAARVSCNNRIYAPFRRHDQILKHMRFAQGVVPYESLMKLQSLIAGLLLHCWDTSPIYAHLVSFFVLSTQLLERLSVAPYLCLVGPPQSGKTTLLELLCQVCRHALLTADVTSASLYDVYGKLTPTLLADETLTMKDKRGIFHFLKAGFTRGSTILRKGRSVDPFGPKVISCTEIPDDSALVSRCLIIPMMESGRTDLKKPSDSWVLAYTARLRMRLLDYRLKNLKSIHLPKIDGDECLSSRTRDLYQALALPVGSNEMYCKFLIGHLKHQREVNREPLSPAAATTLRSLLFLIHSNPEVVKCGSKELMITANLNPESLRLTAHEIGRALTSLGFTDRKSTNSGYVLWLDLRTRERIHTLAHDHGIDEEKWFTEAGFASHCDLCKNPGASNSSPTATEGVSGTESKKR